MTTLPIAKPISHMQLAPGSTVTIPNVSWQEFEVILEELGEKRSTRIAYSNDTLEIMVPLPEHELPTDLLSDIVKVLLKASRRRYQPFGSTTFKREGSAGVEPNACFYIQNYQQMIGRRRLEPTDPPPDLAVTISSCAQGNETDVTSQTTLDAYTAIGVPELWIYANGRLTIYLLENRQYVESETSSIFPELAIGQIIPQVIDRSWQVGSFQALEEFEAMLGKE